MCPQDQHEKNTIRADSEAVPFQSPGGDGTALKPGVKVGDYIIEKWIACGGMGMVYRARQISMHRTVALKVLHRSLSENNVYMNRFFREVRTLANLEHPNLVRAIETGVDNGIVFFSMEHVSGHDLKQRINMEHFFTETEALSIARDVAKALAYTWNKTRLIHRDVKPANIILSDDNKVKLLDLGISKQAVFKDGNEVTSPGLMVGSPTYISPEQARGESDIDFRADIYSLGVTLYHILAWEAPFDSHTPVAVVSMHLASPVPDVREIRPDVSSGTKALIGKMMAKAKEGRPASWEELIEEIDDILFSLENGTAGNSGSSDDEERVFDHILSKRMQPHRIVALCILLLLFASVLYAVALRGIQEADYAKKERHIKELDSLKDTVAPDKRNQLILMLEQAMESAPDEELKSKAAGAITYLNRKTFLERQEAYNRRINTALEELVRRSRELEREDRLEEALFLWNDYLLNGEFRNEPKIADEINHTIRYLQRKMKSQQGIYY